MMEAHSGDGGRNQQGKSQEVTLADRAGGESAGQPLESLLGGSGSGGAVRLRGEWLAIGPALGKMQGEAARRAGEPSGESEEPPPEGLSGYQVLAQTDTGCPAGEVMRHHLDRQPGAVGGEAARGKMVETDAVLEVSDGILDLGVAAMVGLQLEGLPVAVGDEAVIAVVGEEGQLGTGRGLHPPDDEPHRCGVGLGLEGSVGGFGHIGSAVYPVGYGRPVHLGYRLDEIAQAGGW